MTKGLEYAGNEAVEEEIKQKMLQDITQYKNIIR